MSSAKNSRLIFLLLICLALSLRAIYFNQTVGYIQPGSGSDAHFYLQWAEGIVRGDVLGGDVFYALPVYPYFLSLAYLFSGGETFGLILIQIVIGSLNCGLIYLLAKKLFGQQVGIIAAVVACGYSMFIFYDRMLLPAPLSISLGLISALLLLQAKDAPSLNRWLGLGLFLGLCVLTKASFLLVAVFILFWIIFEYKNLILGRRLLYCLSFILSFCLVIGTITLRNYLVACDPVVLTAHSGINFYVGNNPRASGLFQAPPYMRPTQNGLIEDAKILAEKFTGRRLKPSETSNFWFRRSLNFARNQPLKYWQLLGRKFALFWNVEEYIDEIEYFIFSQEAKLLRLPLFKFSFVLPLAILGMFLSWPVRRRVGLLYLFVFSFSLATVFFFVNSRYRLISLPYLIIFASFGLWQALQKCKKREYKKLIFSLILILALYFLTNIKLVESYPQDNSTFHYNKGIYLSDQKDLPNAEKEFQAALAINPLDFMSYLGLGNVYYQKRAFPQAIASYKKSLAINPYFWKPHFNLGMIYLEMDETKKAEEEFKQVLALLPDDCATHYNLGRAYHKQGLIREALREYQKAIKIKPDHWEILEAIEEIKKVQ